MSEKNEQVKKRIARRKHLKERKEVGEKERKSKW